MSLEEIRKRIDGIDDKIAELLVERMECSAEVAKEKAKTKKPVYDPERERQKLSSLAKKVGEQNANLTDTLFPLIFDLSKTVQHGVLKGESPIKQIIKTSLEKTPELFPTRPLVACQGVEGAYSQLACEKIFPAGNIMYFSTFDSVFSAVEQGLCRYGVLPLENSTAGSVNRIYDLMAKHECYIVRSSRVKINHCLLANHGARLGDIKEIYSHEQAIAQCQHFLQGLKDVKIIPCENTAAAAKSVKESGRSDVAALSSPNCEALYGLAKLNGDVQDNGGNYTRFICISKSLEIYPGANRTSLMLVLPAKQGSLYRALSRFNALGLNLIKLESRPLAQSDFEFMFYFDLDTPVYSENFFKLFDALEGAVTSLKYLGSYTEVV